MRARVHEYAIHHISVFTHQDNSGFLDVNELVELGRAFNRNFDTQSLTRLVGKMATSISGKITADEFVAFVGILHEEYTARDPMGDGSLAEKRMVAMRAAAEAIAKNNVVAGQGTGEERLRADALRLQKELDVARALAEADRKSRDAEAAARLQAETDRLRCELEAANLADRQHELKRELQQAQGIQAVSKEAMAAAAGVAERSLARLELQLM